MSSSISATEPSAAYLEVTLHIAEENRPAAGEVYAKYKAPFLGGITGAQTKQLLIRADDVQVLHGFGTAAQAAAYLKSPLFNDDVVKALAPLLEGPPEVRIYTAH